MCAARCHLFRSISLALATAAASAQSCDPRWDDSLGQPGADASVTALCISDALGVDTLFVGGGFGSIGGVTAGRIAQWKNGAWSPLGKGFDEQGVSIEGMAAFDDGSGPALYVVGSFQKAGGILASNIARWDGTQWSPLGFFGNGTFGPAWSLTEFDEDGNGPLPAALFIGGAFTGAGGIEATYIARWDGSAFSPVAGGLNNAVRDLAVHDDGTGPALYAVGSFTGGKGLAARYVARWDGKEWSDVGGGLDWEAWAVESFDFGDGPQLVVGGDFTKAGGVPALRLARWDGQSWAALGPFGDGVDKLVVDLQTFDDGYGPALYAIGAFTQTGSGITAQHIIGWREGEWFDLAGGLDLTPECFAVLPDGPTPTLVVGGPFSRAGDLVVSRIASWRGCEVQCYPDFTGDGTLDLFDFLGYVNAFNAQNPTADCDSDGSFSLFDFLCFVNKFNAGCP